MELSIMGNGSIINGIVMVSVDVLMVMSIMAGGKMHGKGVYTSACSDEYDGELVDDKMHGKGVFTDACGHVYDKEWVDNEHGDAICTFADGAVYKG